MEQIPIEWLAQLPPTWLAALVALLSLSPSAAILAALMKRALGVPTPGDSRLRRLAFGAIVVLDWVAFNATPLKKRLELAQQQQELARKDDVIAAKDEAIAEHANVIKIQSAALRASQRPPVNQ